MPAPPLSNTFESGQSDGTAITVGNSGGGAGDAWSSKTGTVTYSTAQVMHGALSGFFDHTAANQQSFVNWTGLGSITTSVWFRFYIYLTAVPNSAYRPVQPLTAAAGADGLFYLDTARHMVIQQNDTTTLATGTQQYPLASWFRVEGRVLSSVTVGELEMKFWSTPDSGGTPTDAIASAATAVIGANCNEMQFGLRDFGSGFNFDVYLDDIAVSSAGWIGPSGSTPTYIPTQIAGPLRW